MEKWKAIWRNFLYWPGWKRIVSWKGWTGWLKWSGWQKMAAWRCWSRVLFPPVWMVVSLALLTGLGLAYVFFNRMENSVPAYVLYGISFYALVIVIAAVVKEVPVLKRRLQKNPLVRKVSEDEEFTFQWGLYAEQFVNFGYGVFKLIAGAVYASFWIGADGLYNFVQGLIQLYQILRRKKAVTMLQQWKSYRQCGYMMIVLHLTMSGLVFQMIHLGEHEEYPGYMIFATAAFTFYKLISAFADVAKDRKNKRPVDSAVRLLDLSQALYNLFVLQVAMLWEFGSRDFAYTKLMNSLTGGAVCLLVVSMGFYMLWRSERDMRKLEERHG